MNSDISEIIKDLSEALFFIVSTIALILKLLKEKPSKRSKRKKRG